MTLYSIGIVAKHYGVSPSTIRRWAEKGLLAVACRTLGGHRRFDLQLNPVATGVERKHLGYARVSSHDQKEDLLRQAERLKQAGCSEVITDIGPHLERSRSHALCRLRGSAAAFRNRPDSIDVPQNWDGYASFGGSISQNLRRRIGQGRGDADDCFLCPSIRETQSQEQNTKSLSYDRHSFSAVPEEADHAADRTDRSTFCRCKANQGAWQRRRASRLPHHGPLSGRNLGRKEPRAARSASESLRQRTPALH